MAFDVKKQVEDLLKKVSGDKALAAKFEKDPAGTVKELTGLELPEDQVKQVVAGVKAKLGADKLAGAAGALGGILGK